MPTKILACGAIVLLDEEDIELVERSSWHVYRMRPGMKPGVAKSERRYGRQMRVMLHREVAYRRDPSLLRKRFKVYPVNGNYLDVRWENLNVVVRKPRAGAIGKEPRAKGWRRDSYKGKVRKDDNASLSWAGGFIYVPIDRTHRGEGFRLRKCVDERTIVD